MAYALTDYSIVLATGGTNGVSRLAYASLMGNSLKFNGPLVLLKTLADSGNHDFADGGGLEGATRKYLERIEAVQSSSVAAFISARGQRICPLGKIGSEEFDTLLDSGRSRRRTREFPSGGIGMAHWVVI